jgi:hypothetical protein
VAAGRIDTPLGRALTALAVLVLVQVAIILWPSPLTLLTGLALLLVALARFFTGLLRARQHGTTTTRHTLAGTLTGALAFLGVIALALQLSQQQLLFGYKSVDARMSPTLINGDHYLADRLFYKMEGVQKGKVYVIRNQRGKVVAARLAALPGEVVEAAGGPRQLGREEYAFSFDNLAAGGEVVAGSQILARPLIIYGTFDPQSERIIRERLGRVIR